MTATCRFDTKDQKSVMVAKNVAIILLIVVEIKKMNTASGMHNIASSANGKTPTTDLHSSAFNGNEYLPNLLRHHQMPKTESLFKGILQDNAHES